MSRNGSVVWEGGAGEGGGGRGQGRGDRAEPALGLERNPETHPAIQHSATSSSRMGLSWELLLSLTL